MTEPELYDELLAQYHLDNIRLPGDKTLGHFIARRMKEIAARREIIARLNAELAEQRSRCGHELTDKLPEALSICLICGTSV